MLSGHGRYDYMPLSGRSSYTWPAGKRLAVYIGLNLEHFTFGEGLGAELAPGANSGAGAQPDILNYAWRDYGNRVGCWRLLDMLDELSLPCTALVNTAMYDFAPQIVAAHRARGDEIACHGRTNSERQSAMSKEQERRLIAECTAIMTRHEGVPPRGWLSPWIAESRDTPDLLSEAGYQYTLNWCADDQPMWLRTSSHGETSRLLSVPYPQEINDIPSIVARKDSATQFADMIIDDFEERLKQVSRDGLSQVMGIALHPYIVGQPYRLRHLYRALSHITAKRDTVWITTAGAVDAAVRALPSGIVPGG